MPRFGGGHEDFEAERRELEALRKSREQLIAREQAYQQEVGRSIDKEDDAARRREVGRRRRVEAEDVAKREERTAGQRARATDLDTQAIERNTRARQRQAAEARRAAADSSRAFRGARDPLFGPAATSLEGGQSQYATRRALQIGQERIRRMQEALALGYRPSGGYGGPAGPLTRVQAAQAGVARSDVGLTRAQAAYRTAVREAATASSAEAEAAAVKAKSALDAAKATQAASKAELASAEKEVAARGENAAAAEREAVARQRFVQQQIASMRGTAGSGLLGGAGYGRRGQEIVRAGGTDIIPHPSLYGQRQPGPFGIYGSGSGTSPYTVGYGRPPGARPPAGIPDEVHAQRAIAMHKQLATAQAQEATAKGNVTQASRSYLQAMGQEERLAAQTLVAKNKLYQSNEAEKIRQTQRATQGAAAGYGTLSQAMHRHGALTSEFILAASRGEASLRELGNQSVITAGKFAGWTAAATAVYGAVAAIARMGKGAIDASSGVQTLQRVINNVDSDEAQSGFANLAQRFNVPIETVVDAVYRMGQRFHDLPSAMQAAEASLYSFKTGEVDVADSTQYLIAIVNGFGLTAQDLTGVYDQINQAQNRFGIRIGDTEQGLAKAAGTYRNAGGDLDYLLGLFVAISQATGRPGTEIGTGIARGINQFRLPSHVARLRLQGIEVDPEDFQKTLKRALEAAKKPGADLHEISTGLFGNQYARLIEPVLRDQDRLNAALKETSPEEAKGSAQKELATTLKATREQIAAIGINLERLGAELNRAGAFTVFGGLLKVLNLALDTTGDLLEIFNRLPEPLRQAVVLGAQLAGTMALLRRFGATEGLRGGPLGFVAGSGDGRLRTQALRGLRDFRDEARNEAERAGQGAYRAAQGAEIARSRARNYGQDIGRRVDSGALVPFSPAFLQEQERLRIMQLNAAGAAAKAAQAADEVYEANKVTQRAEQTYAKAAGLRGRALREFMAREGIAYPRQLDAPNTQGVGHVEGTRGVTSAAAYPLFPGDERNMTRRGAQFQRRMTDLASAQTRAGRFIDATSNFLRVGGRQLDLRRAIPPIAQNASRAERALAASRGIPGQIGNSVKTITAGVGVLDAALLAFIGLEIVGGEIKKQQEKLDKVAKVIEQQPQTTTGNRARNQRLLAASRQQGPGVEADFLQSGIELLNPLNLYGRFTGGYMSPAERAEAVREQSRKELEAQANLLKNQAAQRRRGGPVGNLFASQVFSQVRQLTKDVVSGAISWAEFNAELAERGIELEHSTRIGPKAQAALRRSIAEARRQGLAQTRPGDFNARFGRAPGDEIRDYQDVTAARISQPGRQTTKFDMTELRATYRYLTEKTKSARTPEELRQTIEDRNKFFDALSQTAEREQQEGLLFARTEAQRQASFDRRRALLQTIPKAPRTQVNAAQAEVAAAERAVKDASTPGEEKAANRRLRTAQTQLRRRESEYRLALRRRALELAKLRDDEYQDRQQGREILLGLRQSQTADSAVKAATTIRFAAQQVRDAEKTYGRGSRQYRQALTELNNAYQEQAQDALRSVEAQNALLVARAGSDPLASARASLQAARNVLSFMQQNSARFDPDDIINAQAQVIQAQNAMQDTLKQQADTLRNLRLQIAQARAEGNPVAQARIAIRYAREAQRSARTPEERLQALLDLINANNELESALKDREAARFEAMAAGTDDPIKRARIERNAARRAIRGTQGAERYRAVAQYREAQRTLRDAQLSRREDDIDFDLEMDKITREDAIQRYQALLRLHTLTREQRRDILRKIKGLKDEAESEAEGFNLDVGNIKLPTLYDVRRALRGVSDQVRDARAQNIRAQTNVTVNVEVNDPNAAGAVYDAIDDAIGTGVAANMRSAGLG